MQHSVRWKVGEEREECSCERLQDVLGVLGLPLTVSPLLLEAGKRQEQVDAEVVLFAQPNDEEQQV